MFYATNINNYMGRKKYERQAFVFVPYSKGFDRVQKCTSYLVKFMSIIIRQVFLFLFDQFTVMHAPYSASLSLFGFK